MTPGRRNVNATHKGVETSPELKAVRLHSLVLVATGRDECCVVRIDAVHTEVDPPWGY